MKTTTYERILELIDRGTLKIKMSLVDEAKEPKPAHPTYCNWEDHIWQVVGAAMVWDSITLEVYGEAIVSPQDGDKLRFCEVCGIVTTIE